MTSFLIVQKAQMENKALKIRSLGVDIESLRSGKIRKTANEHQSSSTRPR